MISKRFFVIAVFVALAIGAGSVALLRNNNSASPSQTSSNSNNQQQGTSLDYSGRGLTQFPKELLSRTDVTSLDISNNQLSGSLPGEIRHMVNLEQLNLSNNRMTGIPAEMGQLKNLRTLNYNNNRLSGLPMELGNLTQLKVLDLSGNPNLSQYDLGLIRTKLPNTKIKV